MNAGVFLHDGGKKRGGAYVPPVLSEVDEQLLFRELAQRAARVSAAAAQYRVYVPSQFAVGCVLPASFDGRQPCRSRFMTDGSASVPISEQEVGEIRGALIRWAGLQKNGGAHAHRARSSGERHLPNQNRQGPAASQWPHDDSLPTVSQARASA